MFNIIKGIASKSIFALGMGTASYYSYGQVQRWVKHETVQVVENLIQKHVTRENVVYNDSYVPQEVSYEQPLVAGPVASEGEEVPAVVPPVAATDEKKGDDEKKPEDAEKKEGEENTEVAGGVMGQPLPQNAPMAYAPQGPAPASTHIENNQAAVTLDGPIALDVLPSPTPQTSGGNSSSTNFNSGYTAPLNPIVLGASLDQADIAALISPMKASFDDETNHSNGLLCETAGRHECSRRNNVPVHSLRWDLTEGLKKDVKFSIKSSGGTSVEFAFDFKIQNTALAEEVITMTAQPSEVLVHNEFNGSKTIRVFEFKFADLAVRGEIINNVRAIMSYEVTPTGLVLSNDSSLSFTRARVTLLTTKWDPIAGTPTNVSSPIADAIATARKIRQPANSNQDAGVFLIADALFFSMSVEKSQ